MFTNLYTIKNCQILVKILYFVAGMTQRFVSAKRLIRYFSNSSKLVENLAQSPVREIKMLAVWPSIAEEKYSTSIKIFSFDKIFDKIFYFDTRKIFYFVSLGI